MTYTMLPVGTISELQHEWDKKFTPERHQLSKDSYSSIEIKDMCYECAQRYKWEDHLVYDAKLDRYFKKDIAQ